MSVVATVTADGGLLLGGYLVGSGHMLRRVNRRTRMPEHTHVWGQWEFKASIPWKRFDEYRWDNVPGQERRCDVCGRYERRRLDK